MISIGYQLDYSRGRTVSFTEMCHLNMSGRKQRPIQTTGSLPSLVLEKIFTCEWSWGKPFTGGKNARANDGTDFVVRLAFVFHHSCRGGTFQ